VKHFGDDGQLYYWPEQNEVGFLDYAYGTFVKLVRKYTVSMSMTTVSRADGGKDA